MKNFFWGGPSDHPSGKRKKQTSATKTNENSFCKSSRTSTGCLYLAYSILIYHLLPGPIKTAFWIVSQMLTTPATTSAERLLWVGRGLALNMLGWPCATVLFLHFLLLHINGHNYTYIGRKIDWALFYIDETILAFRSGVGVAGLNSDSFASQVYTAAAESLTWLDPRWILKGLFCYTVANKLRPINKTDPVLYHTTVAFNSPGDTKQWLQYWHGIQSSARIVFIVISGLAMLPIGLPWYLLPLVYIMHAKIEDSEPIVREAYKTNMMDGVYHITHHFLALPTERAIGVCYNGVFHAPFHATGDTPLLINSTLLLPSYVDCQADLVTWGGPPQFAAFREGETAYALINRLGGQTTYAVKPDTMGNQMTWPKLTQKGESGSPIVVDRDGVLVLVALAGNYVNTDTPTEYSVLPSAGAAEPPPITDYGEAVTTITLHPGGGKTFSLIPKLVLSLMPKLLKRDTIIVTGPTRVVCKEIHDSLSKHIPEGVGMAVRGYPRPNRMAKVVVTAHATLANMILQQDAMVARTTHIIVDESHMDDVGTELVKHYCRSKASEGVRSWFLSATHPHDMATGSNYEIKDEKITESEIESTVEKCIEEGKRVILFCPTIEGRLGTRYFTPRFKNHNPIVLNGKTYASVKGDLGDSSRRLILTTNIAECGINLEADVVVDTSLNYYYIYDNGATEGVTSTITVASMIQRRGRVGRKRIGEYYYTRKPTQDFRYDTLAQYEGLMIARGQSWFKGLDPYLDRIAPTTKQALHSLQESKGIDFTMLTINRQGRRRTPDDLADHVDDWLGGNIAYQGCRDAKCVACRGSYTFWDERYHDDLCKLAGKDTTPVAEKRWGVW